MTNCQLQMKLYVFMTICLLQVKLYLFMTKCQLSVKLYVFVTIYQLYVICKCIYDKMSAFTKVLSICDSVSFYWSNICLL